MKAYKTDDYLNDMISVRIDGRLRKELTYLERKYKKDTSELIRAMIHERYEHERVHADIKVRVNGQLR